MKRALFFGLLLFVTAHTCFSCKHTRYQTASALPEKQLHWGNGGGFTGKETAYILLENGQLFKRLSMTTDSLSEIKGVKSRVAKPLFKAADNAGLSTLDFNHPSNLYYFIGYSGKRVVWGDKNHPVGEPVEQLYKQLNDLLKK